MAREEREGVMAPIEIRPEVLGARLKVARSARRITQEAAAAALDVARTTIVAIEAGKRAISPEELRVLCSFYGIRESELLDPGRPELKLQIDFRTGGQGATAAAENEAIAMLSRLAASALQLEALVRMPQEPLDLPEIRVSATGALEGQAEDVAMRLRSRLGIGLGPVQDVVSLLEIDLGIRVFERPLPSAIAGAVAYDPSAGAFILLNSKQPLYRRRLTAIHELGHVLVRKQGLSVLPVQGGEDREERFFDLLGIAFLAPAAAVRRKADELARLFGAFSVRHLLTMAIFFNVSIEAMARRMETLNVLKRGTYDRLQAAKIGVRHREHVEREGGTAEATPTFTPRTLLLASAAHQRDLVTEQQVASMLELDLVTVRAAMADGNGEEPIELAV